LAAVVFAFPVASAFVAVAFAFSADADADANGLEVDETIGEGQTITKVVNQSINIAA